MILYDGIGTSKLQNRASALLVRCQVVCCLVIAGALLVPCPAEAQVKSDDEKVRFYDEKIKPIFVEHCASCHADDPNSLEGGLGITGRASLLRGGHSGPAVDFKRPDKSLLLLAVQHDVLKMPPDEKLAQAQIDDIKRWIEMEIPWNPEEEVDHGPATRSMVDEKAKGWWAFQPVSRPDVPAIENDHWSQSEIDRFILARLQEKQLQPVGAADRRTLIRRATYDLIGLPPSDEEVASFINDSSPDAFEKLIERLLASPHYGEKWGRHWLDLVRYAESNSFERDATKPYVWRYRDYVIRAFNDDKPYDQFLKEQLAGDELDEPSIDSITATGYYRLGQWDDEPADPLQAKFDELDDILATTSQTMLGLTVNCARCHDHKIDPISQRDYYSMLAFFGNVRRFGIRSPESVMEASVSELAPPEGGELETPDSKLQKKLERVLKNLSVIESKAKEGFEPVEHEEFKHEMHKLHLVEKQVGKKITREEFEKYKNLKEESGKLHQQIDSRKIRILSVKESGPELPAMRITVRGNPHVEGAEVGLQFPEVLSSQPVSTRQPREKSSGARRLLADWIASANNPMTARVMVNRIWQFHFGEGIVRTSSDFGYQGSPPSHPELLDWLASEFVASNWSIKAMHRKIMLSAAYQMSGSWNQSAFDKDPTNQLMWRFRLRRLTAEELRDSVLMATGEMNLSKLFGPSIFPKMPDEVLRGQSIPGNNWPQSIPEEANRRSVYVHVKRSMQLPILATHDTADTDSPCPVRFVTTQSTQSLTMLNSEFCGNSAKELAKRLIHSVPGDVSGQIRKGFQLVTQRQPTEIELQKLSDALKDWQESDNLDSEQALQQLCLLLLNLNEFVYVD